MTKVELHPKFFCSSKLNQYFYKDVDTDREVLIKCFWPTNPVGFWTVEREDGSKVQMHYSRIFVKQNNNENNKEIQKSES